MLPYPVRTRNGNWDGFVLNRNIPFPTTSISNFKNKIALKCHSGTRRVSRGCWIFHFGDKVDWPAKTLKTSIINFFLKAMGVLKTKNQTGEDSEFF